MFRVNIFEIEDTEESVAAIEPKAASTSTTKYMAEIAGIIFYFTILQLIEWYFVVWPIMQAIYTFTDLFIRVVASPRFSSPSPANLESSPISSLTRQESPFNLQVE